MEPAGPIRVVVVDDNAALRLVVQSLLRRHADIQIVGEARNGEEALAQVGQLAPDVVLMDINMPRMNGVETTRRIKASHPGVIVIGLTLNDDVATTSTMHLAGASSVVQKERVLDDLHQAILDAVVPTHGGIPETPEPVLPSSNIGPHDSTASTSLN
jgi:DNA-binding NarL/FixJ family response regulator